MDENLGGSDNLHIGHARIGDGNALQPFACVNEQRFSHHDTEGRGSCYLRWRWDRSSGWVLRLLGGFLLLRFRDGVGRQHQHSCGDSPSPKQRYLQTVFNSRWQQRFGDSRSIHS